jgi:O-antigen/teichoic acid export membrane protein
VQREDLEREHCDTAFWTALGMGVGLALIVVAIAQPLSNALGEPALAEVILWLSVGLPIGALGATPGALMTREFQFRGLAVRRLIAALVGGIVGVACAMSGAGVWSLVAQSLVTSVVATAVLWRTSTWRPRFSFSKRHFWDLWNFGVSVLAINMMGVVNQHSDRFIVGAIAGPTVLGFYHVGLRIVSIAVDSLTAVVATVTMPTFSRMQTDLPRLRRTFYMCTRLSALVCIPMFVGLAVLTPILTPLLFGRQWEPVVPVTQVLCALAIINSVAYFDRNVLLALRRERWALGITAGQAVLNVIVAVITAPFGILAVAIGVTVRQYLFWPLRIWVLRKALGVEPIQYLRQWVTPVIGSAAMAGAMLGLDQAVPGAWPDLAELVVLAVAGGLSYLLFLRLFAPASLREVMGFVPARWKRA